MSRLRPTPVLPLGPPPEPVGQLSPPTSLHRSDSGSSSGSSHTSHSSHQERERQRHLGEDPDGVPNVVKPAAAAVVILLFLLSIQATALWIFTKGFLLTKTTLDGVAQCDRVPVQAWQPPRPIDQVEAPVTRTEQDILLWEENLLANAECTLPSTYDRAFVLIIDALRYDFIAPIESNATTTPNPFYHDVFTLPSRLDRESRKSNKHLSFLSHFLADAPTTTLQRLKGLTTGTLPTFIDAGSNFGGTEIVEDNWISQLKAGLKKEGAKLGFAGDDTWITVFPTLFDSEYTFPFDSFNVEDLDTVDQGVKVSLLPVLHDKTIDWRLLIGHTLGVDHVGHRLGTSHPRMRTKLEEMDEMVRNIIDTLPKDSLFVLLGDHGMDDKGDHGGDGELEVGSGLWIYAQQERARRSSHVEPIVADILANLTSSDLEPYLQFSPLQASSSQEQHRSVAQIDLVPTMSLLMGLPIPFNNLGTVIPEVFLQQASDAAEAKSRLLRALRINAIQIHRYLAAYSAESSDLQPFEASIRHDWHHALLKDEVYARLLHQGASSDAIEHAQLEASRAYLTFTRSSLGRARSVWAKFEMFKIVTGLVLLGMSLATCLTLRNAARRGIRSSLDISNLVSDLYASTYLGTGAGAVAGLVCKLVSLFVVPIAPLQALTLLDSVISGAALGSQLSLNNLSSDSVLRSLSLPSDGHGYIGALLPILHSIAFSSNSFTVYEDKIVLALVMVAVLYRAVQGFVASPTTRLQIRIPALMAGAALLLRFAAFSRICREEQGPECKSTFYGAGDMSSNSPVSISLAYVLAFFLPTLIGYALGISKSFAGVAPLFVNWLVRPALLAGAGFWLIDWLLTSNVFGSELSPAPQAALKWAKMALARADMMLVVVIGVAFWIFSPLCLELKRESVPPQQQQQQQQAAQVPGTPATRIIVLGFANSLGSSYLLLLSLVTALLFLVAQSTGQIVLVLSFLALVCCAEAGDGERDGRLLNEALAKAAASSDDVAKSRGKAMPPSSSSSSSFAAAAAAAAGPRGSPTITFLEVATLALIGFVTFYATGHQATFASIQWRTAFVGFDSVVYPFSPLLVALNSFGPVALLPAMAVPLLALWNLAPKPRKGGSQQQQQEGIGASQESGEERMPTLAVLLDASLSFILYHSIVTFSSALFAAHFKRHLMLFKIWTPRFMTGAVTLLVTHLGIILGLLAAANIMSKVIITFGSRF